MLFKFIIILKTALKYLKTNIFFLQQLRVRESSAKKIQSLYRGYHTRCEQVHSLSYTFKECLCFS